MSSSAINTGYALFTDPDQGAKGFYKLAKTTNITTTLAALNGSRAAKDFKTIKFFQCSDLKKLDEFLKSALKSKFISGSTEWIKVDEPGLAKLITTIETLATIVNESG